MQRFAVEGYYFLLFFAKPFHRHLKAPPFHSEVNVRAAKVVAGLEAENTNVLLQMLAVIADSGIDGTAVSLSRD